MKDPRFAVYSTRKEIAMAKNSKTCQTCANRSGKSWCRRKQAPIDKPCKYHKERVG